jgi:hypothetical protein
MRAKAIALIATLAFAVGIGSTTAVYTVVAYDIPGDDAPRDGRARLAGAAPDARAARVREVRAGVGEEV